MFWTNTIVKNNQAQDVRSTIIKSLVGVLGGTPCLEIVGHTVVNQFHQKALFLTHQSKGYYSIWRLANMPWAK